MCADFPEIFALVIDKNHPIFMIHVMMSNEILISKFVFLTKTSLPVKMLKIASFKFHSVNVEAVVLQDKFQFF